MARFVDLSDPTLPPDPFPLYARLRAEAPLFQVKQRAGRPTYLVTRYDDVLRVLKDPLAFTSDKTRVPGHRERFGWMPTFMRTLQDSMVLKDGVDHRRLRTLVHKAFTPTRVDALGARIESTVERMLSTAAEQGRADLMSGLALPLPLTIISDLLGVPESAQKGFRRYMAGLLDVDSGGVAKLFTALPRILMLMRLFRELIEDRRKHRGEDLISDLISAEESGDALGERELLSMVFLLLLAGHETTVNLIGNGVVALLDHPEQLERLRANPELIDSAVEELLRYVSPVQLPAPRHVLTEVELGGEKLQVGGVVIPLIASANRDDRMFPEGHRLDLGRTPNKHLAFGFAAHYCVGAPLARLEAKHAFLCLVQRFPKLRLAQKRESLRWRRSLALRGLRQLPVLL